MPEKSAEKRKEVSSKEIDGEKFLSTKEKKIKSFESFSIPQRPKQGDTYQQLDTEEHSEKPSTDMPSQEPISRPNDGDTYQNLQDDNVANNATNKIKNTRPGQGDKYQKLSTGKMKSFESFINEDYKDELKKLDDKLEDLLDTEPYNKEEEKEHKEAIEDIEDQINDIKFDQAEKEKE
jgi:hypothetical protein